MANIFIAVEDAEGHIYPMLPLMTALAKKHDVVCMTGRKHRERIEKTGARFTPMPIEYDPNGVSLYEFHPELKELTGVEQIKFYINDRFIPMGIASIDRINELRTTFEPDIYIGCAVSDGPLFLAQQLGKPSVKFNMLPLAIQSKDHAPFGTGIIPSSSSFARFKYKILNFLVGQVLFKSSLKKVNEMRKDLGLNHYSSYFYDVYAGFSKILVTSVPEFDYHRSDLPASIEYVGPVLPEKSNDFTPPEWWSDLESGKTIVLVNQGTLSTDITDLILPTIRGLSDQDCIVIAVPVKEDIPGLPGNVRTSEFVPFAHLLPYVDVMITNGGFGATQMALAYGIPLILGGNTVDDKMEISARAAYTGCGIDLKAQKVKPEKVKKAYREIMSNPSYRQNAERLKDVIAGYDPIEKSVEIIEKLTYQNMTWSFIKEDENK